MAEPVTKVRPDMAPAATRAGYAEDYYTWVLQQADLLRTGCFEELDVENVFEEFSDLARREYDKLESALAVLLMHMLKWDHQAERRDRSWALTIAEQRERISTQLRKNPGLKSRREEAVQDGYRLGRLRAANETGLKVKSFPKECPYDWDAILKRAFGPDES